MKYYDIVFPNHTTITVSTHLGKNEVIAVLHGCMGIETLSGATYNTQSFLYLNEQKYLSDTNKKHIKTLEEVLV